jgi:DNA repair exonuclease SbcCD nuclease subunit
LHIDSPFKGFSAIHPEWAERLREAPLQSFLNIVDLAILERVDAVIIAGDVFDGEDKSLHAQFKFRNGLQRLSDQGIPSFIAHGNHDPLNSWSRTLKWPEGVTVFPGDCVQSVPVVKGGQTVAHVYGTSFPERDMFDNLTQRFERQQDSGFAPCAVDDLVARGMDYWALGHIHLREVLRKSHPAIVYCGNSQGRHFKESGSKGCCLVTLNEGAVPNIQFLATDTIRFVESAVDVSACASLDAVVETIVRQCKTLLIQAEGRSLVVRQTLIGRTDIHALLRKGGTLESLRDEVFRSFSDRESGLWLEFRLQTRGAYDIDALKQGKDFIADLIALYDSKTAPGTFPECREPLKDLFRSWEGGYLLSELTDDELREILFQARNLTLDMLINRD